MTAAQYLMPNLSEPVRKGSATVRGRMVRLEETVARVRPLIPAMGITRIANVTGLDCIGIPVVMVCRPNSRSLAVSQGKGLDLAAAAKASALMESVESYHAERITLPLKLGSYEELRYTHRLVDLNGLPDRAAAASTPTCRCSGSRGSISSSKNRSGYRTSWRTSTTRCRNRPAAAAS